MGNYAVFLEPQGMLRQEIISLKNLVNETLPGQKYCNHPPHCTLIFGAYQEPEKWMDELHVAVSLCDPFELDTENFHVFYHDQQAGGGHTVVIRIENSSSLFSTQAKVGEILSSHKLDLPDQARLAILKKEPFKTSMERYGFPFIGEHWLPHFSIASLKIRKDSLFLKKLLQRSVSYNFMLGDLSIWEVDGDRHTKLYTIQLKGLSTNAAQR